jgi:hypothetical protein
MVDRKPLDADAREFFEQALEQQTDAFPESLADLLKL